MSQQLFSAVTGTHAHACHVLFECSEISLCLLIKLFDCCDKERGYSLSETQHLFQRFCIGSNGSGYPFEPNCHSFEQLWLSVEKIVIHSKGSHYPLEKKLSSVRAARVICLKQYANSGKLEVAWKRDLRALGGFCRQKQMPSRNDLFRSPNQNDDITPRSLQAK